MMIKRRPLFLVPLLALGLSAFGYIEALTSFKGVLQESHVVARGVIDAVSLEKKIIILRSTKNMKGKCVEKIKIDMNTGEAWHPDAALRHAVVGAPVTIFYHKVENSEKVDVALVYNNRFFMSVLGGDDFWRFAKIELAMNRVYSGTAEELNDQVLKMLSGRTKPPAPNAQLRPWTKESLAALPPPPKEGEKWAEFDAAKAFKLEKTFAPDPEGFLQYWLLAGPIPIEKEISRPEGTPKEGDKLAGEHPWKAYQSSEFLVDLAAFAAEAGRDASKSRFVGVTYLFAEQEAGDLQLAMSSDEESTWWLNGRELGKFESGREFTKDKFGMKSVSLAKGRNILTVVAVNKANPAAICARFLDKDGKPFRNFVNDSSPR
jgi:hypothetical protein